MPKPIKLKTGVTATDEEVKTKILSGIEITPTGCWEWQGRCRQGKFRYGQIRFRGKQTGTHQAAYELFKGPVKGMCVCHVCDNPPCCNPDHLFLGTRADNNEDKRLKGRLVTGGHTMKNNWMLSHPERLLGEQNAASKLTEKEVRYIKVLCARGMFTTVLAKMFGVTPRTIGLIRAGEAWPHVRI